MQVYNTTEDVISDYFGNLRYDVGPDEIKHLTDDCGYHLIRRQKANGLVMMDYGIKEEEKYGSLKNYKLQKKIEGLKAYKDWTKHCLDQESMFKREVVQKNGGEVELAATQVPKFEKRLKRIGEMLSQAEKDYDAYLIGKRSEKTEEVAEEVKPKRGRPFTKREVINVDSITT